MAQHDYTIANQGFPATRADINNVLQAIATNNTGTSAPTTLYAGQFWIDTTATTWVLYIHDGTDNIQFAQIDTSANTVNFIDSALANDVVINTSGAITTTGAFTSVGIDDNATSTAMTIDSNENVLVGTTSNAPAQDNVTGVSLRPTDASEFSQDGELALNLNRKTSNGEILRFRKDGSAVGSIGTDSTGDFVIDGSSGHSGIRFKDTVLVPKQSGSDVDNTIDLGKSDKRFKDLYLGGGAFIGGTSSSNKLDDYETGLHTVTATDSGGGATITMNTSFDQLAYTKIGRVVHIQGVLLFASISGSFSGSLTISLPFTSSNETDQGGRTIMGVGTHNVDFTSGTQIYLSVGESSSTATLTTQGDNIGGGNGQPQGSGQLYIGGSYIA